MPIILKAIFFTAAIVCFCVAAWREQTRAGTGVFVALGLALFATPFAFDAWAAVD